MKNIKKYGDFINEDNFTKDKYYQGYDKYPEDILSYSYPPKNDVRDLDGAKVWEKANKIGMDSLNEYKAKNPNDKYGGSSVLGSGIVIEGVEFPNPVYSLHIAGCLTMGLHRFDFDRYHTTEGGVNLYTIPNRISQGSIFQEMYAKPIVEYLNSLGFEASYNYGKMD